MAGWEGCSTTFREVSPLDSDRILASNRYRCAHSVLPFSLLHLRCSLTKHFIAFFSSFTFSFFAAPTASLSTASRGWTRTVLTSPQALAFLMCRPANSAQIFMRNWFSAGQGSSTLLSSAQNLRMLALPRKISPSSESEKLAQRREDFSEEWEDSIWTSLMLTRCSVWLRRVCSAVREQFLKSNCIFLPAFFRQYWLFFSIGCSFEELRIRSPPLLTTLSFPSSSSMELAVRERAGFSQLEPRRLALGLREEDLRRSFSEEMVVMKSLQSWRKLGKGRVSCWLERSFSNSRQIISQRDSSDCLPVRDCSGGQGGSVGWWVALREGRQGRSMCGLLASCWRVALLLKWLIRALNRLVLRFRPLCAAPTASSSSSCFSSILEQLSSRPISFRLPFPLAPSPPCNFLLDPSFPLDLRVFLPDSLSRSLSLSIFVMLVISAKLLRWGLAAIFGFSFLDLREEPLLDPLLERESFSLMLMLLRFRTAIRFVYSLVMCQSQSLCRSCRCFSSANRCAISAASSAALPICSLNWAVLAQSSRWAALSLLSQSMAMRSFSVVRTQILFLRCFFSRSSSRMTSFSLKLTCASASLRLQILYLRQRLKKSLIMSLSRSLMLSPATSASNRLSSSSPSRSETLSSPSSRLSVLLRQSMIFSMEAFFWCRSDPSRLSTSSYCSSEMQPPWQTNWLSSASSPCSSALLSRCSRPSS